MPLAKVYAVIPAAGTGSRMGNSIKKQYLKLGNLPVLAHTLQVFEHSNSVDGVVLVVGEEEVIWCRQKIVEKLNYTKVMSVVPGGNHRQQSVHNGLMVLPALDEDIIIIHDGARPMLTSETLEKAVMVGKDHGAAVVAVPVKDTIKIADSHGRVVQTPNRDVLWSVQTPQVFNCGLLRKAYQKAIKDNFIGTDDSSIVERLEYQVQLVMGNYENIKITTAEDMLLAEAIISRR